MVTNAVANPVLASHKDLESVDIAHYRGLLAQHLSASTAASFNFIWPDASGVVPSSSTATPAMVLIPWRNSEPTRQNATTLLFNTDLNMNFCRAAVQSCLLSQDTTLFLELIGHTKTHTQKSYLECMSSVVALGHSKTTPIFAHTKDRGPRTPTGFKGEALFTCMSAEIAMHPERIDMIYSKVGSTKADMAYMINARIMRSLTCTAYQTNFDPCNCENGPMVSTDCRTQGQCQFVGRFVNCNMYLLQCILATELDIVQRWLQVNPRKDSDIQHITSADAILKEKAYLRVYANLQNQHIRTWISNTRATGCAVLAYQSYLEPMVASKKRNKSRKLVAAAATIGVANSVLPMVDEDHVGYGVCELCNNYCDHVSADCLRNLQACGIWDEVAFRYAESVRTDIVDKVLLATFPNTLRQPSVGASSFWPGMVHMVADYLILLPGLMCLIDTHELTRVRPPSPRTPPPIRSAVPIVQPTLLPHHILVERLSVLRDTLPSVLLSLAIEHLECIHVTRAAGHIPDLKRLCVRLPYLSDSMDYVRTLHQQSKEFGWETNCVDWINLTRLTTSAVMRLDILGTTDSGHKDRPMERKSTPPAVDDAITRRLSLLDTTITDSFHAASPVLFSASRDITRCCTITEVLLHDIVRHNDFNLFCAVQACAKFCCVHSYCKDIFASSATHFARTLRNPPLLTVLQRQWLNGTGGLHPPDPVCAGLEVMLQHRRQWDTNSTHRISGEHPDPHQIDICSSVRLFVETTEETTTSTPTARADVAADWILGPHNLLTRTNISTLRSVSAWQQGVELPAMLSGMPLNSSNRFFLDRIDLNDILSRTPGSVNSVHASQCCKENTRDSKPVLCLATLLTTVFGSLIRECWKFCFEVVGETIPRVGGTDTTYLAELRLVLNNAVARAAIKQVSQCVIIVVPKTFRTKNERCDDTYNVIKQEIESAGRVPFCKLLPSTAAMMVYVVETDRRL